MNVVNESRMPRWMRGIFIANLVAQSGIIVTGAVVRLTGSGLGCPTWPQCVEGSYTPTVRQEEGFHKFIEFGQHTPMPCHELLRVCAVDVWVWTRRSLYKLMGSNK